MHCSYRCIGEERRVPPPREAEAETIPVSDLHLANFMPRQDEDVSQDLREHLESLKRDYRGILSSPKIRKS